jgi:FKBP-type peptidyl-prolyl cis-trans isomerase 2
MILFNAFMQYEKIAIIALVIIIIGALSIYLATAYSEEILNNLFPEEKTIEIGDCADVNYIGTFVNGTVFDTSYAYPENKTGGTPLKVFITMNQSEAPPTEYPQYSSGLIEGFMEGLIGLKEGETATIGPIPPEKAYGARKIGVGDTLTTSIVMYSNEGYNFNQTFEVIESNAENITIKWIDVDDLGTFTLPEGILMEDLESAYYTIYENLPPFFIWENATEVTRITDDYVELKIMPTTSEKISDEITFLTVDNKLGTIFPDATTAEWDNTSVTITSSPLKGANYSLNYMGTELTIIVDNITEDHVNITIEAQGEKQSISLNRTITFNRTYSLRRNYIIPGMYQMIFTEDFEREGYSTHELAGEELIFKVTIEEIYKTSQEN